MGWFDNDKDDKSQPAGAPTQPATSRPAPQPAPRQTGGSTLGERVHVNGTIHSEEALRILGRVEGTIRAREELAIAKGADVRAVIHGRRVLVEGNVKGDVHAAETVVLGPTAVLEGNIATPALQIEEGAFFKGAVEMGSAETQTKAAPAKGAPAPAKAPAPSPKAAAAPSASADSAKDGKPSSAKEPASAAAAGKAERSRS